MARGTSPSDLASPKKSLSSLGWYWRWIGNVCFVEPCARERREVVMVVVVVMVVEEEEEEEKKEEWW